MNSNTVNFFQGGTLRNQLPLLVLASTTETAIQVKTDTGTAPAFLAVPTGGIVGSVQPFDPNANDAVLVSSGRSYGAPIGAARPFFNSQSFDFGRPFTIRLFGTGSAAANAGNTLTVTLRQGTSTTATTNTSLCVPISALATASAATFNFYISCTCYWDSTSGNLSCTKSSTINYNGTQTVSSSAAGSVITSITNPANLVFTATVVWGNAVGGTVSPVEFSIEQV